MKVTKINTGYYLFEYRGYNGEISKVEGMNYWYFLLDGESAHDWQSSFKNAKSAAIEYIDYLLTSK